jgi:hypothetical protein
MREKDAGIVKRTVQAYAKIFKSAPVVPDKGINNVVLDLIKARPDFKNISTGPNRSERMGPWRKC